MRVRRSLVTALLVFGILVSLTMSGNSSAQQEPARPRGPALAGEMGDYVVVPELAEASARQGDLSHDGWTWGSGRSFRGEPRQGLGVAAWRDFAPSGSGEPWICPAS